MTTVGLLTLHNSLNYGATLQCYALQRTITEFGYAVEVIDFRNADGYLSTLSWTRRLTHSLWHSLVARALVGSGRQEATAAFRAKTVAFSNQIYRHSHELRAHPPEYDAYVCGSDQVWNFRLTNSNTSYLLDFVPAGKGRIAYAASFGFGGIAEDDVDIFHRELIRFDAISLREESGQAFVEEIVGRSVDVVLDPTLLLSREEWADLSTKTSVDRPYILCYYMPGNSEVNRRISSYAEALSEVTGWKIVRIGQKEYRRLLRDEYNIFDAGPREFVGLFRDAQFVLTNSFHGTVFAVIFQKPFYCFADGSKPPELSLSGRITSLLDSLGLSHRQVFVRHALDDVIDVDSHVDYAAVDPILQRRRQVSLDFLENALSVFGN